MQKVIIDNMDTCLSYALKRIGCFNLYPIDYGELTDGKLFEVFKYDEKKLRISDIILWGNSDRTMINPVPTEISEDGRLLFHRVYRGFHCAVYEGNGLLSDCSRDDNYLSFIRVMRVDNLTADMILRKRVSV